MSERQRGWWLWSVNWLSVLLWPLSLVFCLLVRFRYLFYTSGLLGGSSLPVPVIVVGNITVGGNGKTPVVHYLVNWLQQQGYHVGIISRGYGAADESKLLSLSGGETSTQASDEVNMLSQLCGCPLVSGADRLKAAWALLEQYRNTQVLVADDGLQHYRLPRCMEIVVDRKQARGNGWCLPAGPLREPVARLKAVDLVIERDGADVQESLGYCWKLSNPELKCPLEDFTGQEVCALAGIGFPQQFFNALQQQGLVVEGHAFADHYRFTQQDLDPLKGRIVLVTHKDAVKLHHLVHENIWVVPLELQFSDTLQYRLQQLLEPRLNG